MRSEFFIRAMTGAVLVSAIVAAILGGLWTWSVLLAIRFCVGCQEAREALKAADVPEEHTIRVLRAPSMLPQAPDIDTPPPPPRAQTKRRAEADAAGAPLSQHACVCQWCVDDPTRHCFKCE